MYMYMYILRGVVLFGFILRNFYLMWHFEAFAWN